RWCGSTTAASKAPFPTPARIAVQPFLAPASFISSRSDAVARQQRQIEPVGRRAVRHPFVPVEADRNSFRHRIVLRIGDRVSDRALDDDAAERNAGVAALRNDDGRTPPHVIEEIANRGADWDYQRLIVE